MPMDYSFKNTPNFFMATAIASGAEIVVTYPLLASIVFMQKSHLPLYQALIKQYKQGLFRGFMPALYAKLIARMTGLALGDGLVGDSMALSDIAGGAVAASTVEAAVTNYHITKARLLIVSSSLLHLKGCLSASVHSLPSHVMKNTCVYFPMFVMNRYGADYLRDTHDIAKTTSTPLLAAMTGMLMQPATTVADTWMTITMLRSYQNQSINVNTVFQQLRKMPWSQNLGLLGARTGLFGATYAIYYKVKSMTEDVFSYQGPRS